MRKLMFGALALMAAVAPASAQAPAPGASVLSFWDGETREVNAPNANVPGDTWTWKFPSGPYVATVVVAYRFKSGAGPAQLNCRLLNNNSVVDRTTAMISGNAAGGSETAGSLTLMSNTAAYDGYNVTLSCNSGGAAPGSRQFVERVAVRAVRYTDGQALPHLSTLDQHSPPPPQLTRPRG